MADALALFGYFHGGQDVHRYVVDQPDLVHKRQRFGQAIGDQHAVVGLHDAASHVDAVFDGPLDHRGGYLKVVAFRDDHDHRLAARDRGQLTQMGRDANADAQSSGRSGVVADHRGLGDDRFGDGFHGDIANHRRGFVQQRQIDLADADPGHVDGLLQGSHDARNVTQRALDAGSAHSARGQKPGTRSGACRIDLSQRHFGGRIAYVNSCDQGTHGTTSRMGVDMNDLPSALVSIA